MLCKDCNIGYVRGAGTPAQWCSNANCPTYEGVERVNLDAKT